MCPDARKNDDRCVLCPTTKLDFAMFSPVGRLLRRSRELLNALDAGMTITSVRCDEYEGLMIIREELNRYEKEQRDKSNG
jgi:hypothetical protein